MLLYEVSSERKLRMDCGESNHDDEIEILNFRRRQRSPRSCKAESVRRTGHVTDPQLAES